MAGRRGPRHRRVRGYAGRYSGIGGRHDPPSRKQCEQRIFVSGQLTSVEFLFPWSQRHVRPILAVRNRDCSYSDLLGTEQD